MLHTHTCTQLLYYNFHRLKHLYLDNVSLCLISFHLTDFISELQHHFNRIVFSNFIRFANCILEQFSILYSEKYLNVLHASTNTNKKQQMNFRVDIKGALSQTVIMEMASSNDANDEQNNNEKKDEIVIKMRMEIHFTKLSTAHFCHLHISKWLPFIFRFQLNKGINRKKIVLHFDTNRLCCCDIDFGIQIQKCHCSRSMQAEDEFLYFVLPLFNLAKSNLSLNKKNTNFRSFQSKWEKKKLHSNDFDFIRFYAIKINGIQ